MHTKWTARRLAADAMFAAMVTVLGLVSISTGNLKITVEALPVFHELKLPLLDPWAAADPTTDHPYKPSYVFRLSLRDSWALQVMIDAAARADRQRRFDAGQWR